MISKASSHPVSGELIFDNHGHELSIAIKDFLTLFIIDSLFNLVLVIYLPELVLDKHIILKQRIVISNNQGPLLVSGPVNEVVPSGEDVDNGNDLVHLLLNPILTVLISSPLKYCIRL